MLPLFAGGQLDRGSDRLEAPAVALTGRVQFLAVCLRIDLTLTCLLVVALALTGVAATATAEPAMQNGVGAAANEISIDVEVGTPVPVRMDGLAVVSYVTPSVAPAPRGLDNGSRAGHWTLRDPFPVRVVKSDAGASSGHPDMTVHVRSHAGVAMFSWREIAFAALVVAFALGALLALTGGGDNHRTRHY